MFVYFFHPSTVTRLSEFYVTKIVEIILKVYVIYKNVDQTVYNIIYICMYVYTDLYILYIIYIHDN